MNVLYPKEAKFNKDYYKSTHMPLVEENWKKYGLKSWKIIYFDQEDAKYHETGDNTAVGPWFGCATLLEGDEQADH